MSPKRPKHLDLTKIRLPLPALVSILHRVSGAVLFLFIGLFLYLLQQSLASPEIFAEFRVAMSNPLMKLVLLGLLWSYLHHVCAGIRHLALDLDLGTELAMARLSSIVVLVLGAGATLLAGVMLW